MRLAHLQRGGFTIGLPSPSAELAALPTSQGFRYVLACEPLSMRFLGPIVTEAGGVLLSEEIDVTRQPNRTHYELPGREDGIRPTIVYYQARLAGAGLTLSPVHYVYGTNQNGNFAVHFYEDDGQRSVVVILPHLGHAETRAWYAAIERSGLVESVSPTEDGYRLHLPPGTDRGATYQAVAQERIFLAISE